MSTTAPADSQPRAAATQEPLAGADGFIETYYRDGGWHSRRHDSESPFSSGEDELDQIALGSQVARWNRLPHIVRTTTGSIAEVLDAC
ncbi:hypothetical protein AB0E69_07570 [Kribbella sp. NPDC026611]|uniref:hypothetical protein n=1 Tax=Kribbella sp. NPDC026611 TaxID=3154911 RepID=UPI0033D89773